MQQAVFLLGGWFMVLLTAAGLSIGTYLVCDFILREVLTRMRRVYNLTSVWFWLHHYEKLGRKCFLDPELDSRAKDIA